MNNVSPSPPENFQKMIMDMTDDLQNTFPEYSSLWSKWTSGAEATESDMQYLFEYCLTVYPERFFDILYQNESMFDVNGTTNTFFLPSVDFKLLYNCENVSETSKKILWKYLQLILFSIIGSVKNKTDFGETMNIFDGIDETELHQKLSETIQNIGDFFENIPKNAFEEKSEEEEGGGEEKSEKEPPKEEFHFENDKGGLPNVNDLHEHIKQLFDGKIGSLAKELAEEISNDLSGMFDEDMSNVKSTQDILQKLMKNPTKITELIKTVNAKLNDKFKSGEISQNELMTEATDIIKKMQSMAGGNDNFKEMFQNLAKMSGIPGMNKNTKFDMNAVNNMTKQQSMREKMKANMMKKKEDAAKKMVASTVVENNDNCDIQQTHIPNNFVFKFKDTEDQTVSLLDGAPPIKEGGNKNKPKKNKKKQKK